MSGHVDDVVGATHDRQVAVGVLEPGVGRQVVAGIGAQVRGLVGGLVVPQRRQAAGGQRQLDDDIAGVAGAHLRALVAQDAHIVARYRHRARSRLDRQHAQPHRIAGDRPSGLGLPPVVDHRHAELLFGPSERGGVGALPGEEQRPQSAQVVAADVLAGGIVAPDGAKGGRRGEEGAHVVLRDHPPEGAGVRRPHRLALVEHRRVPMEQRPVDDIRMAHRPAEVGRRPVGLAGLDAVEMAHAPGEGDQVAAVVADDALGIPGGA